MEKKNVMSTQMLEVSCRSRSGALSRKGCVVNGQMTKASIKRSRRPPPYPTPAAEGGGGGGWKRRRRQKVQITASFLLTTGDRYRRIGRGWSGASTQKKAEKNNRNTIYGNCDDEAMLINMVFALLSPLSPRSSYWRFSVTFTCI